MNLELKLGSIIFLVIVLASIARSESLSNVSGNKFQATEASTVNEHISIEKWKAAERVAKTFSTTLVKNLMPFAIQAAQEMDLSPKCSRSLMTFLSGVKQMKLWAFRMLDSSGKIPNGIFSGSINALGDFDECIHTNVPGRFKGQYCLVDIKPPLPPRRPFVSSDVLIPEFINVTDPQTAIGELMRLGQYYYHLHFRTSVCVPSTCNAVEVEQIALKVMESIGIDFGLNISHCETAMQETPFSKREIAIVIVLCTLLLLGVTATVIDVGWKLTYGEDWGEAKLGIPIRCLLCFSFYTNTKRLLKNDNSPDSIKIFHGMKVITILWVILNHTYYYLNFQAGTSLLNAREIGKEPEFQFIANGFLNVETFFFISSVLVAYGVMKMKERKLNICLYVFRRFWRLTPPFMLVIACVHLLHRVGSGPVWKETVTDGLTEKCKSNWWTNLLYINNFFPSTEMCLQWTWYIPVDTHMYFLSLFVLIPLKRNPRLAFLMNGAIFLTGIIISATANVYYGLQPTAIYVYNNPEDINNYVDRGYFRTYLHFSTYCVGLTVGYILASKRKITIPLIANVFGWAAAFGFALTVLYGVYDWNQGNVPGIAMSTLYTCTNKLVWSLALAWVTVACMTGHGGIVTSILSWEAFVPLGRLTYMAYLVHPIIQLVYIGSTRTLIRTAHRTMTYMYLGDVVLAFICAFGLSLLFESPFMALEKVFFSPSCKPKESGNRSKEDTKNQKNYLKNSDLCENNRIYAINIKQLEANNC